MKFVLIPAIFFALLCFVKADLLITQPLQASNWKPGSDVSITWQNSKRNTPLTGKLIIDLMEGSDPTNLGYVLTIKEGVPADSKMLRFYVPKDLPLSANYSIRITADNGDQAYSPMFPGGSGAPFSGQAITETNKDKSNNKPTPTDSSTDKDTQGTKTYTSSSKNTSSGSSDSTTNTDDSSSSSSDEKPTQTRSRSSNSVRKSDFTATDNLQLLNNANSISTIFSMTSVSQLILLILSVVYFF
ncbi:hypothetical protein BB559_007437 [Furculomyces boomerangus]|uniref:Yeast cell wall synthesis Kre9/Knh1-like N-terminal domain-containing protein n=2 Tax=Harpellales TaxID=61421 RepID=A0A2T9XXD6_9FUNG|nr:hypothetical protein BB559_007437 [Furculomyces boomerangus]PVZ98330.1 hypothetical protein BB558_005673 [Smittium angustum]